MTAQLAARDAESAVSLLNTITGRGWIAGGLGGAGMAALGARMRPIDALSSAGLGAFTPHVQPLQDVLDRMAGNASVIRSFADAWQRTATAIDEVQQRLARAAAADSADWRGAAGDGYRNRAGEISQALRGTAALSAGMGTAASTMGEVVAAARIAANELLTDLVQRLISYVTQARAAEGGLTPNVMAQATQLINSYGPPIAGVERNVLQTIGNLEPQLTALGPQWTKLAEWFRGRRGQQTGPPAQTRGAGPPRPDERGVRGRGGAFLDGDNIVLVPRDPTVPTVTIPNNTGASGFEVGPAYDVISREHTYRVQLGTGVPFDRAAPQFGDAIARNPVPPSGDQPANPTGARNDALWGDYVRSYRVPSPDPSRYTDITVNYTIAGEHRLHEGYVIRYGERMPDGTTRIVSYGEGNSPLQHPLNVPNRIAVDVVWNRNHREILDDVQRQLGSTR